MDPLERLAEAVEKLAMISALQWEYHQEQIAEGKAMREKFERERELAASVADIVPPAPDPLAETMAVAKKLYEKMLGES